MGKSILFVDDEKQILKSFKRLFLQSEYAVFLAESGAEALKILSENPINLVITDVRMPTMDGIELLEKVKALYPDTLRIILSGYAEENQILKALQNNLARTYIFKPWVNEDMISYVKKMLEFEDMLKEKHLLKIIDKITEVPSLLDKYDKLCTLIDSKADIGEIAELIEEDPAIVGKILYIANSSFYALKTGSIRQVIAYLGLNNLKNIVLTANLFSVQEAFRKEAEDLWKHSVLVNKLIEYIYERVFNEKVPENAASAGLLHDIGKIVMLHIFKEEYAQIMKRVQQNTEENSIEIEKEVTGTNHQEIGGVLLNWWGLPFPIVEAAFFHHSPSDERVINNKLIYVVHIADYYAHEILGYKQLHNLEMKAFYGIERSKEDIGELMQAFIRDELKK